MKQVYSNSNITDLIFAKSLLNAENIAVFQTEVHISSLYPTHAFEQRLFVSDQDYDKTIKILQANDLL